MTRDEIARGRRCAALVAIAMSFVAALPVAADAAPTPAFATLQPGRPAKLDEAPPVQVVFIGYEEAHAPREAMDAYLPPTVKPVDRTRFKRTGEIHEIGLRYDFDYSLHYADRAYEDAFFGYLSAVGVDERALSGADVSLYQFLYNLQPGRSLDITDNLVIDAALVERWLVEHPAPGVDPNRNTLVFINWWGRPDFRFHDYRVSGEKQTETGVDFARYWSSRLVAWGGTSAHDEETGFGRGSRTWFHDLSAGPDWRTGGWVIDDPLGFGPDPRERMFFPPVWDYLNNNPAIADRWALPDAIGTISRFVAVNMLFGPSPLFGFDPDARVPTEVELDVTIQSDIARPVFTPAKLRQELGELLGFAPPIDAEHRPLAGTPRKCLYDFAAGHRCRPETDPTVYDADANLYLGAEQTRPQWQDGSAEHEAPGFVQATEALAPKFIGMATDNLTDGTRAATFAMPNRRQMDTVGYGPTSTMIHEYGHYFGLSHSHDGWEGQWWQANYSAHGFPMLYFTWVGTEVSSSMSYMFLNDDFSQFDLDNYQRWQAVRLLRGANMIAADVLASRRANAGTADLVRADALFTEAQTALRAHDYRAAERKARGGYAAVRAAAVATGTAVPASPAAWTLAQPGKWRAQAHDAANDPSAEPMAEMNAAVDVPAELMARFEESAMR